MTLSENLVKINLLRKGLDELRPLSKQATDKLWEKLRLEWNYNSNHIEGNTLTYSETKLLLLFEKTTGDHEKREYDEMQAHDVAIHLIKEWAADKDRELTEADIRSLNKIILVRPYWKEALTYDGQPTRRQIKVGDYKEYPNSVRLKSGEMFHYASPEETPRLMQELLDWYKTTDIQHPVYLAAELHYKFIRIHPFDDGNGRIARLLVNYVLLKNDYTPVIIKSADKENYITALQKADAGDKAAFPNYMAEQLIWSLQLEDKAAKGESLEEPDDIDKEIAILKKQTTHENKLTEKGTPEAICNIIDENIIPLIKNLEKRCYELRDLFFDYDRYITYKKKDYVSENALGSKEDDWESLAKKWVNETRGSLWQIVYLQYSYRLKGLKKVLAGWDIWIGINIQFDDYNYTIKTPEDEAPIRYAYGKTMSEDELYDIIKPSLKKIINRIKDAK